jgi:hypothetical protein
MRPCIRCGPSHSGVRGHFSFDTRRSWAAGPLVAYAPSVGLLYYGEMSSPLQFDDRLLAHLKVAITQKLRRGESFTLSWVHPPGREGGRTSLWIGPSSFIRYEFETPASPPINAEWIERLLRAASTTGGMVIVGEDPTAPPTAAVAADLG